MMARKLVPFTTWTKTASFLSTCVQQQCSEILWWIDDPFYFLFLSLDLENQKQIIISTVIHKNKTKSPFRIAGLSVSSLSPNITLNKAFEGNVKGRRYPIYFSSFGIAWRGQKIPETWDDYLVNVKLYSLRDLPLNDRNGYVARMEKYVAASVESVRTEMHNP